MRKLLKFLWKYKYQIIVLAWLLGLTALVSANEPKIAYKGYYEATELFVEPFVPHYYDYYQDYKEIVDCLIKYESGGNIQARGDNNTSFGILQFKKNTFQYYCVENYSYRDDIWDAGIQKSCSAEMVRNGLINHWTLYRLCL